MTGRILPRIPVVVVLAAAALGVFPPAVHGGVPPTVVRTVAVDEARLVPPTAAATLTPQGAVRVNRPAWTGQTTACAPIRFTTVGLVWRQSGGEQIPAEIAWGGPQPFGRAISVTADPDEGPDPGSPDDAGMVGTPPVWAGEARCTRFRLRLPGEGSLADLRAVFVNTSGTATEPSPLETAGNVLARAWGMATDPFAAEPAAAATGLPAIIPRSTWGAKESLRKCGPDYAPAVKMAYVHHTVNKNGYASFKADDIVRAIYAYHVKGNGWCDIGYNFLIDRFGRIYEGRYGGIDRPVVGAHAMGFNAGSAGVAAIGTFTTTPPRAAALDAFRRLLAWRLDVAHVRPTGTTVMRSAGGPKQKFDKGQNVPLPVISGHRETGYTACPGARLYGRLSSIRTAAEQIGLPKIWDPVVAPLSGPPGTPVRFTANLSTTMAWTIDIIDANGIPVRQLTGTGATIDATWDGRDATGTMTVPAGIYTAVVNARDTAGNAARNAVFTVTLA